MHVAPLAVTRTAIRVLSAVVLGAGMSVAMVEDADAGGRRHGGSHYRHDGGRHHAGRYHGHYRHHAYRHHRHHHRGYPYWGYGFGLGLGFGSLAYRDPYFWDDPPPLAYYVPPPAYTTLQPPVVTTTPVDPPYPPVPAYQPAPIPGVTDQSDGAGSDQQPSGRISAVVTHDPSSWPMP